MLPLDDALKIIADVVRPLTGIQSVKLANALNAVTAEEITAPYSLPPFTNTGVDGYAFCHEKGRDVYNLVGASYAGEPYHSKLKPGQATRIATGAVLPDGADTVVMQEVCRVEGDVLHLQEIPFKGSNLRHAGGDIKQSEPALKKGQILRAQEIALLNALGMDEINIIRPLRIAIASTGLELAQSGQNRHVGQIVDTNSLMLSQMLESKNVIVTCLPPLPDAYEATHIALQKAAAEYDLIITTGGVSVGDRDFVRDVMHEIGKVHFWKLAIRPGKPVIFGSIDNCLMVGLPGNPVSAYVTCFLVVRSIIRALQGNSVSLPEGFLVPLATEINKPAHLRGFARAVFRKGQVHPYPDQSSNLYASLTFADGLLDLPAGRENFVQNEQVLFRPFSLFLQSF